jgi:hypothetical protein
MEINIIVFSLYNMQNLFPPQSNMSRDAVVVRTESIDYTNQGLLKQKLLPDKIKP